MRKIAAETQKTISQSEKFDIDALVSVANQNGNQGGALPGQPSPQMMPGPEMVGPEMVDSGQMTEGVGVGPETEMG